MNQISKIRLGARFQKPFYLYFDDKLTEGLILDGLNNLGAQLTRLVV